MTQKRFDADLGESYALLYNEGHEHPSGMTQPGSYTDVAAVALEWCAEALEWDGRRHAVILYRSDGDELTVDGYVGVGAKPELRVVKVQVVE